MRTRLLVDGKAFDVELEPDGDAWRVVVDGTPFEAVLDRRGAGLMVRLGQAAHHVKRGPDGEATVDGAPVHYRVLEVHGAAGLPDDAHGGVAAVKPPMAGTVERVAVAPGDDVEAGDVLFVLEAMKMRNEVRSPIAGRVMAVHAEEGRSVDTAQVLVEIEAV